MGSASFKYTGRWQQWRVPSKVKEVTITIDGGGSGLIPAGRVTGRLAVNDKQTLYLLVGGAGVVGGTSTVFGGGGAGGKGVGGTAGNSGGGASAIRVNSSTGTIRVVAGGAGGTSGDAGTGGQGGNETGENGFPGTSGIGAVGNATGGTQIQGGAAGTSGSGVAYYGLPGSSSALGPAGGGGSTPFASTVGGGGGGGGYRPGGGGQAGLIDVTPAGGGGGGSNYVGGLISWQSTRGGGGLGNGSISLSWINPPPANQPPSSPSEVKVAGQTATDEQATRAVKTVTISAKVDDPSASQRVRLRVEWTPTRDFTSSVKTVTSTSVAQGKRASVTLTGLSQDTHYWARLWTLDSKGLRSKNYTSVNFWSNRRPTEPELIAPASGASVAQLSAVVFQWNHLDPDSETATQNAFRLRWRLASSPLSPAGSWTQVEFTTPFESYTAPSGTFKSNFVYEWQVQTQDAQKAWGPWSLTSVFFVTGEAIAPLPTYPVNGESVEAPKITAFAWRFRDPDQGDLQSTADLRWRRVGNNDWVTLIGDGTLPGINQFRTVRPGTFEPGYQYEWQVRTTDTISDALSDWSESAYFWATVGLGAAVVAPVVEALTVPREALGSGNNRAFIYLRGGKVRLGELTPLTTLTWNRARDDIGSITAVTNGLGDDGGGFYGEIRSWLHEIVVFRDGVRVAEGPITRITDNTTFVEFEAKDVMGYVYRRALRQGYNDSYRKVNGVVQGDFSVVQRAAKIIQNALAPDDPNILPYLTTLNFPDDAGESRVVPAWSKTAWEEVDDMAATAGLDYTTVGRRIMLWDTHRPLGRLAEMRSENFSDPPIVTEYGMQMATDYGITNNSGIFGIAHRGKGEYGLVEMLSSAYGETDAAAEEVLTAEAVAELQATFTGQAERSIAPRWPTPVVARVPDNSTLDPTTNVGINDLVPGVWIPLRAKGGVREVAQWQKLDLVTVSQDSSGEKITVTMSPAPNGGNDPDSEGTVDE